MRNKSKMKLPFPLFPTSSWAHSSSLLTHLHSWLFHLLSFGATWKRWEWRLWLTHTPLSLPLLPSHAVSLFQYGILMRQYLTNFSNVEPSQGLQFFSAAPVWILFHGIHSFRNRLLQLGFPMEPDRNSAPVWIPHYGKQLPSGHIQLIQYWVPHLLLCSTVVPCGLQSDSQLHLDLLHRLRGNTCSIWSIFSIDLGDCEVVSQVFIPLLTAALSQKITHQRWIAFWRIQSASISGGSISQRR